MPGSKRRALKKLLSPSSKPNSSPSDSSSHSASASGHLHPSTAESGTSLSSMTSNTSIASNPGNYLTDEQLERDLELEKMAEREQVIGSGRVAPVDEIDSRMAKGVEAVQPLGYEQGGLPGAVVSPPPPPQGAIGRQGEMGMDGGGGKKKSSKQKFAERQARKKEAMLNSAPPSDPNWDAQLEKERQEEIRVISDACAVLGREIHEITPDGHCMYHAISHQLATLGIIPPDQSDNPSYTRKAAANYMMSNPDEFRFFLPSVSGEDTAEATEHEGVMTEKEYGQYCNNVANTGEWGGEPEIQALSRTFNIPIHVIQRGPPTIVSHGGANDTAGGSLTPEQSLSEGDRVVRISYHRRMYGLGEHYNSLSKVA